MLLIAWGNLMKTKISHFFAFLRRMRFIRRWSLMRNTVPENIQEHSLEVAWIAHQLALLRNIYFEGNVNAERAAVLAMYHEVSEIFTGDMPTPVKYFDSHIRSVYGEIELAAQKKLLATLPKEIQTYYEPLLVSPEKDPLWPIVKAADTLSAFMKCVAEKAARNGEFNEAYDTTLAKLESLPMPEVQLFMEMYIPSLSYSLDKLNYTVLKEEEK